MRFPTITESRSLLKISFRTEVLRFNTEFSGRASLSTEEGSFQNVVPGNSAKLSEEDNPILSSTTVSSPSVIRKNRLVDALEIIPDPFTPNGDGINDQIAIAYNVLALTKAGKVAVQVFDLSGRSVKKIYDATQGSGRYFFNWDGKNDQGETVLPGIYLLQIAVEGDNYSDTLVQSVAVAY